MIWTNDKINFLKKNFITSLLTELDVNHTIKKRVQTRKNSDATKSSIVGCFNRSHIKKFGDFIYHENLHLGLKRKQEKYLIIMSMINDDLI